MDKRFVIVCGLPASGKSTLAQRLAPALSLPLLDKDTILERLFDESKGVGDAAWRRALSRESDFILQNEATASDGAILVSHWHLPGMPADSGTPTAWLAELPGKVVTVHCACSVEIAARRFVQRRRHSGHCDSERSESGVLESVKQVAALGRLNIGQPVEVDTTRWPSPDAVLRDIHDAFRRFPAHLE
jgi:glucokinase